MVVVTIINVWWWGDSIVFVLTRVKAISSIVPVADIKCTICHLPYYLLSMYAAIILIQFGCCNVSPVIYSHSIYNLIGLLCNDTPIPHSYCIWTWCSYTSLNFIIQFSCDVITSINLSYYFYNSSICLWCIVIPIIQSYCFYNSSCVWCKYTPINHSYYFYNSICTWCSYVPVIFF